MHPILIVDDEEGFRHILQLVLQRAGYVTLTACNASEAQAMLDNQPVHLIILDDMMPGLSGSEWCTALKADERTRHIPVLMHSAHARLHQPGFVEQIGADGVLLKPCPPREIVSRVQAYFPSVATP
jgi:DNA-binding response OmpR family regulator